MIPVKFTKAELWAVIFAVSNDLETVKNNLDEFGEDLHNLESSLAKLERADRESSEG